VAAWGDDLIAALSPEPEAAEQALRDLITRAQQLAAEPGRSSRWDWMRG
jgi:hypothetical protein